MNQLEARKIFKRDVRPSVIERYGKNDQAAISEAWGIWLDGLCRDGIISMRQYETFKDWV